MNSPLGERMLHVDSIRSRGQRGDGVRHEGAAPKHLLRKIDRVPGSLVSWGSSCLIPD